MSRIGKLPVVYEAGVLPVYNNENRVLEIKGNKGVLRRKIERSINLDIQKDKIVVTPVDDTAYSKAIWGLTRKLISNMVEGVTSGYSVELEIIGVGFKAAVSGKILKLALGFSHDIYYAIPEGISVICEKPTSIVLSGCDKERVTQMAAEIRAFRPPEPYKGKGIRYKNEKVRRKEGKKK